MVAEAVSNIRVCRPSLQMRGGVCKGGGSAKEGGGGGGGGGRGLGLQRRGEGVCKGGGSAS